jgi:hypothetical protein
MKNPRTLNRARGNSTTEPELATAGYPNESAVTQQAAKDTKEAEKDVPGNPSGISSGQAGVSPPLGQRSPLGDFIPRS